MIPLVDLKAQYQQIQSEIDTAIASVIQNTHFIGGQELEDFESAFAAYQGTRYAVGCASGTSAIFLVLRALGIKPGDEIITTPHTFIATVEPIEEIGAIPIFVDIDPQTYNIDPAQIEAAISPRTRAIMPVHLYGQLAPMDEIMTTAKRHDLYVIEDAAQAHGAMYKGKKAGQWGDAAAFSFYPGKNLGAYGDGGAICTDNPDIAHKVARLRNHGRTEKYEHDIIGYGERLDTLQAAILHVKLQHLNEWNASRRRLAGRYNDAFTNLTEVTIPYVMPESEPVFHIYCLGVSSDRNIILETLKQRGVGASIHYPIPVHLQPALAHRSYQRGDFPNTESTAQSIISLPLYPEMTEAQQQHIIDSLQHAMDAVG